MHYATLHQVKSYLGLGDDFMKDDQRLIRFIDSSVGAIDNYKGRRFDVRYEVRRYDVPRPAPDMFGVTAGVVPPLRLKDDLLDVVTLINGDGTEIEAADFVLEPANTYPKARIVLYEGDWLSATSGNDKQVIQVSGYWGYHSRYQDAFEDSLDSVQNNPLTANVTTLSIIDAGGVAGDGSERRFQTGQMLRIEDEFIYVAGVNYLTNILTVKRGYNGTTKVQHEQGTVIEIFRPMANINFACIRLAAWRYRQKDADAFDKAAILGSGVQIVPSAMPADVKSLLGAPKATI